MSTNQSFDSLYQTALHPVLQTLETARQELLSEIWKIIGWLILMVAVFVAFIGTQQIIVLIVAIAPLVMALLTLSKYNNKKAAYEAQFKDKVIRQMILSLDNDLNYSPNTLISAEEFLSSNLFRERIDAYTGGDLVEGKVGETRIRFSELFAQHREVYSNGKQTQVRWVTIFKGIFFIADFNKAFHSKTVVLPDSTEGIFGGFSKFLQNFTVGRGALVKLESNEFENYFVVYSFDQVEARYILSPALMERMVNFRKQSNRPIYFSFCNSNIYIGIPSNENLFEPNIFSSGLDLKYLKRYYDYINICIGLVEELNLNTRIWTKE